jgi:hypothetical protein
MSAIVEIGGHIPISGGFSIGYGTSLPQAATPTFSPVAGTYATTQTVSITCTTPSSSIYFTTDGSTPTFPITGTTTLYTGPLTVSATETIKAIGVASGFTNSAVGSASYTIGAITFDFFISTTGSDSNSGALGSPWAITSLQDTNSNNSKIAAKRVGLIAGTYACSGLQSGSVPGGGSGFQFPVFHLPLGTSTNPTYVASCNSSGVYTPLVAILDNSSSTTTNPLIGQDPLTTGGWFTIDGIKMLGNPTTSQANVVNVRPNSFSDTNSQVGNSVGVTITNCDIGNIGSLVAGGSNTSLIFIQGASQVTITNNFLHDMQKVGAVSGDNAHCHLYEEYGTFGTIIHQNTFANCPGGGVDMKAGDQGGDIAFNYFYNVATEAATNGVGTIMADGQEGSPNLPTASQVTVHNNVFDSCGSISYIDVAGSIASQNLYYYNNTTYDTRSGSHDGAYLSNSGAQKSQYYNNIYVTTANTGGGSHGTLALSAGQFTNVSNNCYFYNSSTGGWGQSGSLSNSLTAWKTTAGNPDSVGSIAANPIFIGTITPGTTPTQFQLGSGSPCLGTGTTGNNMGAWDGVVTQIGATFAPNPVT